MGGGISYFSKKQREEQMKVMIAHYSPCWTFRNPKINTTVQEKCSRSLDQIYQGRSPKFIQAKMHLQEEDSKEEDSKIPLTPLVHFFDLFYSVLFEIEPSCKEMFESVSLHKQSRMLFKTFKSISKIPIDQEEKFMSKMRTLIDRHTFEYNVHPIYYSYFCEAILKALRQALGNQFDREMEHAWVCAISYLIKIIIPIAVAGWRKRVNMECAKEKKKSLFKSSSKFSFSVSSPSYLLDFGRDTTRHIRSSFNTRHIRSSFNDTAAISPSHRRQLRECKPEELEELFDRQMKWPYYLQETEDKQSDDDHSAFELGSTMKISEKCIGRNRRKKSPYVIVSEKKNESHLCHESRDGDTKHYSSTDFDNIEKFAGKR